ncbi:hypothetical protein DRN98_09780 [Methanosarcinales archaeon]|nr:MAG: hypothetical protein DRN98_09780 [Methanosarcinales archaeon]
MKIEYARLKEKYVLRGWRDLPFAIYDWKSDRLYEIEQDVFNILQKCDGTTPLSLVIKTQKEKEIFMEIKEFDFVKIVDHKLPISKKQKYRKASNSLLRNVCWLITGYCNLNCIHCYIEAPKGKWGELSFEDKIKIIEELERSNVLSVVITGGEPFVSNDIEKLVRILIENKIHIRGFNTNGIFIPDKILSLFEQHGLNPDFSISYDGLDFHDAVRGKSGVEKDVILNIEKLLKKGFRVSINTSLAKSNANNVIKLYEKLKEIGIHAWRINTPSKIGNWKNTQDEVSIETEAETYKQILKRWLYDGKPFQLSLGSLLRTGKCSGDDPENEEPDLYYPNTRVCEYYYEECSILPDGTLVPCQGYVGILEELRRMPNILEESLSTIWDSSRLREIKEIRIKDLLEKPVNRICASCKLLPYCGMGCRIEAYVETGDLYSRAPRNCKLMRKYYEKDFMPYDRIK